MLLFFVILYIILVVIIECGEVPSNQIDGLYYLYNSTGGSNWIWSNATNAGIPWDFNVSFDSLSNPCMDNWQGINCTENCISSTTITCYITVISLYDNNMVGSIPSEISLISTLSYLSLTYNALVGSLPVTIEQLTSLTTIHLNSNKLSGNVLSLLMPLVDLQSLELYLNHFSGTIPNELGTTLTNLNIFDIVKNDFNGTIPSTLGLLNNLKLIDMYDNSLSGTIPSQLTLLNQLRFLELGDNFLTSSVPSGLSKLSSLSYIAWGLNTITGTMPSEIGLMTNLTFIGVSYNSMDGTLPSTLMNLNQMKFFSCRFNYFSAPEDTLNNIAKLPLLDAFLINRNLFSGNFKSVQFAPSLQLLRLSENFFTGSYLLTNICNLSRIVEVSINSNQFSGSIPSCVGNWSAIRTLDMGVNQFGGTIPTVFQQFSQMVRLVVESNSFSGPAANMFQANHKIQTVVLSDNRFTGSIPQDAFQSDTLTTFIGSKNCFGGSLSESLCNAVNLRTLALSGLTAGVSCEKSGWLGLDFGGYTRSLKGAMPECLFAMTELQQLYLSGNGIESPLFPMSPDSALRNLSLSYNRLSGAIPISIQTRSDLQLLDLSFNRLLGTIEQMTNYSMSVPVADGDSGDSGADIDVVLSENHLSGSIPSAFSDYDGSIDILDGNMFECTTLASLPDSDPKAGHYSCGSDVLYVCVYVCISVCAMVCTAILYHYQAHINPNTRPKQTTTTTTTNNNNNNSNSNDSESAGSSITLWSTLGILYRFVFVSPGPVVDSKCHPSVKVDPTTALIHYSNLILYQFRWMCLLIAAVTMTATIPLGLLKMHASTYSGQTHQYGWVVSMAFLDGILPGVLIALLWCGLLIFLLLYEHRYIDRKRIQTDFRYQYELNANATSITAATATTTATEMEISETSEIQTQAKAKFANDVDIDRLIVEKKLDKWEIFYKQCAIVTINLCISLCVNGFYVYIVITQSFSIQVLAVIFVAMFKMLWPSMVIIPWLNTVNSKFLLAMVVMISNVIVIPLLAAMAVEPACFSSMFIPQPPISTTFSYRVCHTFYADLTCLSYVNAETTISFDAPTIYNNQCFSAIITTYVPSYVISFGVVGIVLPFVQMCICAYFSTCVMDNKGREIDRIHRLKAYGLSVFNRLLPLESIHDLVRVIQSQPQDIPNSNSTSNSRVYMNIYYSRYVSMNCIMMLTLLLTFGITYPPLSCVLVINVFVSTLAFQLSIHYHAQQVVWLDLDCKTAWHVCLYNEVSILHKIIFGSRLVILLFSSLFASFVLYDTVSLESSEVAWALIGLVIGGTYGAIQLCRKYDAYLKYNPNQSKMQVHLNPIININNNGSSSDSNYQFASESPVGMGVGVQEEHAPGIELQTKLKAKKERSISISNTDMADNIPESGTTYVHNPLL